MEQTELKITVQISEKDYFDFNKDHFKTLTKGKLVLYSVAIIFLLAWVYAPLIRNNSSLSDLPLSVVLLPFIFVFIYLLGYFAAKFRIKRAYKSDALINQPYEVIINENGLVVNAYKSNMNRSWEEIYRYNKTKNGFYIYLSEQKSIIIPKRYFENEHQENSLLQLLNKNINAANYNKNKRKIKYIRIVIYVVFLSVISFILYENIFSAKVRKEDEALTYEINEDYINAKRVYSELILEYPNEEYYYAQRANCEIYLNEIPDALKDTERAIKINPKSGRSYYFYAYALYNSGKYEEACKAMNKSKELGFHGSSSGFCEETKDALQ